MINHHKFKFMQKKDELKSFNKDMKKNLDTSVMGWIADQVLIR